MQVLAYWLMRTAMFLGIYGVLWTLKWFDIWAVLVAFVVGWAASYVAFPGMRKRAALEMDGWITRSRRGNAIDDADEDAEAEAE
jgi:hypothetical protein